MFICVYVYVCVFMYIYVFLCVCLCVCVISDELKRFNLDFHQPVPIEMAPIVYNYVDMPQHIIICMCTNIPITRIL